ncbi:unnamed protein product [Paramecium octaurelia]|uniref:Uncharacterized protein n=1 Tax=Paramecium octaurelia TaxID=43137 RepID=A0A8S1U7D3_PAROT|nr:unnamed protein product [Paramecium octaurelia]
MRCNQYTSTLIRFCIKIILIHQFALDKYFHSQVLLSCIRNGLHDSLLRRSMSQSIQYCLGCGIIQTTNSSSLVQFIYIYKYIFDSQLFIEHERNQLILSIRRYMTVFSFGFLNRRLYAFLLLTGFDSISME